MKALVSFLSSIFKIRTDGDVGAILLREHSPDTSIKRGLPAFSLLPSVDPS